MVEPVGRAESRVQCSFCLKDDSEVGRLIAGPGCYICGECVHQCMAILADDLESAQDNRAGVASYQAVPDAELLIRLPRLARAVGQVDAAVGQMVAEARRRRIPWQEIGAALGVSRQSAWERFHRPTD